MSLELKEYIGKYYHPMYGDILVTINTMKGKKSKKSQYLNLDVNKGVKNFNLDWWEEDTFITDKDEKWREKLLVDFIVENKMVESLKIYNVTFKKDI